MDEIYAWYKQDFFVHVYYRGSDYDFKAYSF